MTSATAQGFSWLQVVGAPAPTARQHHAMTYDAARQRVVLFGGNDGQVLADTWQRGDTGWSLQSPAASPPARTSHALAHDAARQRVVLFGGLDATLTPLGDTWEWDGSNWSQRMAATPPTARDGHAMAYDAARQRIVLFGGRGAAVLGDTWLWDGSNWSLAAPATNPVARADHAMAYDELRQRVVLFGGNQPGTGNLGDTWEWNGTTWLPAFSPNFPSARSGHAMSYDASSGFTVLFGGSDSLNRADTWTWNGGNWTLQLPAAGIPSPRQQHAMAFDSAHRQVVMFGGGNGGNLPDTWLSSQAAGMYGAGCGTPPMRLEPDPNAPPLVGQFGRATVVDAPSLLAAVAIGASRDFFGPFPLPVTLAGIGATGCDLWQSADLVGLSATPLTATTLSVQVPIPNLPQLFGLHLYLQAYAFAPGQNPLQVTVSNGLDWTIGCPTTSALPIIENFDNEAQLDIDASAGSWANGFGNFSAIGGDGRHGAFDISLAVDTGQIVNGKFVYELNCDNTVIPAANTTTGAPMVVTDGRFFFSSMVLENFQRLRFVGSTPPVITVAGLLDVRGDIEVLGQSVATVPTPTQLTGQPGAMGGIGGGRGGQGGDRCQGFGPSVGNPFDGRPGEDVGLVAGHGYAAASVGTGGRGSQLYPASGLNVDQQFGSTPPVGLQYCLSAGAGGSGGGLQGVGQNGMVTGIFSGATPLPNQATFMGPIAPGGNATQLLPFPPPTGIQRSSLHFLVTGSGGGGSASNCSLSLSLARSWATGAGGGGGGGAMALRAGRQLLISPTGQLLAAGGSAADNVGFSAGAQVAPAGGGSGGSIVLQSGRTSQLLGSIDISGGQGGFFRKTGGGGIGPNGGIVEIQGGDGSPGFVRFEMQPAPPISALGNVMPFAPAGSVGALTEVDDMVAMRSRFYTAASSCVSEFRSYEIQAIVDGLPVVFSDDPSVSTMPATTGAPLRALFQAAQVDAITGEAVPTGPWRGSVGNRPGQIGIAADGGNGYRFLLVFDRALANTVSIDQLVVTFL